MAIVPLVRLDGVPVGVDPSEVFSLQPVPEALLPPSVPDGTYVNDGIRVAVVGTVAAVAALLGIPVPALARGRVTQPFGSFALSVTYTAVPGCVVVLPVLATYRLAFSARSFAATGGKAVTFRLFDATAGAPLPNTEVLGPFFVGATTNVQGTSGTTTFYTTSTVNTSVELQGIVAPAVPASVLSASNGMTALSFEQLT